jgi:hypothetical protein
LISASVCKQAYMLSVEGLRFKILTDRPTLIGSYIISENALVKILNIEQFVNLISEILHNKTKQYWIPYCKH